MAEKMDMKSKDWLNENTQFIAERFPNCVTETEDGLKVDFELLQQELSGDVVSGSKERYRLEWPGKRQAMVNANLPTTKTLRPVREDSVDFDNTENLYIEGDNLEVLKILQESYLGKVKMIYIDPPYNTNGDFVYEDSFAVEKNEYLSDSSQINEYNERLKVNLETSGRYHSKWLGMMLSRLRLARNLMSEDGVLLTYIDEHEVSNLERLLKDIFGENNYLGTIIWDKKNPKGDAKGIAYQHESILVASKNKNVLLSKAPIKRRKKNATWILDRAKDNFNDFNGSNIDDVIDVFRRSLRTNSALSGGELAYNRIDEDGRVYRTVSMAWPNKKKAPLDYMQPIIHPGTKAPCAMPENGWRYPSSTIRRMLNEDLIVFGRDHTTQPTRKYFLDENLWEAIPSILRSGKSDVKLLKELKIPFDTPKVTELCAAHIDSFTGVNDTILDFFSGSATVAHATLIANTNTGSSRKFICVQIPEQLKNSDEFETITELGRERIKRAAAKIKEETGAEIDYGFKVYRVDESNMEDVYYQPQTLDQGNMDMFASNIKADRTSEDLLTQVLLDWGLPLTLKTEKATIAGKEVFKVAGDSLFGCFDDGLEETFAKAVAAEAPMRLVVKDSAFESDTAKVNVQQLLKQLSPNTELKVI